ncbi:hypothetical protein TTHERM_00123940 (macronuclear) [Tetrahymena thermophila SB210]|uniref:Transmembrane protein n=1 Tax=Tetrahymena thermophila (strain SB210) TaxID=312017 RepID=Q22YM7_TETTS|nr:hypothetical protein TTHERM_00123940 [Tetrahymena thermophila SB210]EAR90644.1 hypothetical protein TTHERM_00123940 [Tetrahymena thermophila SB210]|eukprot:XP_001010889.1 hypothetical protein TTHERM_00123940 [Tetrahymena thermophila SB210]
MSKTIILALLATYMISITLAANNAPTCSSHLAFSKAKNVLSNVLQSDSKGKSKNEALQKQFQNAKPANRTAADLGVCSQYANQNSCCDKNMVKLIDTAALLKVKPILQSKSAFQKLVSVYVTQVTKNCSNTVLPSTPLTFDAIFANTTLKVLQANKTAQATCRINFAKAISSFTRGALCSICAGVEKINDYFNAQGQLKISQSSVNTFIQSTDQAISCTASFFTPSNIELIVKELNAAYIKNNDKCGANVLDNIKTIFANPKISNDDGKGGKICKGTTIFGDNSACENILQGDASLEKKLRLLRAEEEESNRLLQASSDAVIDPNGVSVYTTSNSDNQIDETGNGIAPNFDQISTNNSIMIGFTALSISLFALLF